MPAPVSQSLVLPHGIHIWPFLSHVDPRGTFTEIFRTEWPTGLHPVQWNLVSSAQGVLRGVHVHLRHDDYMVWVSGRASIGLCDLRPGSPTERLGTVVELDGTVPQALLIPHGVAHGFYCQTPSIHILGVTHYFDHADELGCHWADPALQIPWPSAVVQLSDRDAALLPLASLIDAIPPWQPT